MIYFKIFLKYIIYDFFPHQFLTFKNWCDIFWFEIAPFINLAHAWLSSVEKSCCCFGSFRTQ